MRERTCTGRGYGMREFECTPIELRAKSFLIPEIARGVEILSTRVQGKLRGCETSWDKEGGGGAEEGGNEGWRGGGGVEEPRLDFTRNGAGGNRRGV